MPDEPAESHLLRIQIVNGLNSRPVATQRLKAEVSRSDFPLISLLADHCGVGRTDYAVQHTFLPVMRISADRAGSIAHGVDEGARFSRYKGMVAPVKEARFCLQCTSDDVEQYGFSWYRRTHHLVGMPFCAKHNEPLYKDSKTAGFLKLPHLLVKSKGCERASQLIDQSIDVDDFVRRFNAIMLSFLNLSSPFRSDALHSVLGKQANKKGVRLSATGVRNCASDVLKNLAPSKWLEYNFPHLNSKKEKLLHSPIDSLLFPASKPGISHNYALLIALLFESVDEFYSAYDCFKDQKIIPGASGRKKDFWYGEAYKHYLRFSGDINVMSEAIGMDPIWLREKMREIGMPHLSSKKRSVIVMALYDFCCGMSLNRTCQKYGIDAEALEAVLRNCTKKIIPVIKKSLRKK